jgi:GNAT superfamily N-acetyltransferase
MPLSLDETLERTQWDFFWVPEDVTVVDRPEIAYVKCARRVVILNQVTRTRAAPSDLGALVREVVDAHRDVGSRWLVPAHIDRAPLERALERGGYSPAVEHHACAIAVEAYRPRPSPGIVVHPVDSVARLRDCHEVSDRAFGPGLHFTDADREQQLEACTRADTRVHRFVAYDEATGEPLSSGGVTLFPALRFGFLWAGGTVPEARGRGAYSAVLEARIRRARERGIAHVGLYAVVDTSAPIVLNQGFERHGRMTYWDLPAAP